MPEALDVDPGYLVELDSRDLNAILAYIVRIRSLKAALDQEGKVVSLQPERQELKALINAARALRRVPHSPPTERVGAPSPISLTEGRALPELYGNHMVIPEDWQPAPRTAEWAMHYLQQAGVHFDMAWLVAEFVTYWRSRDRVRANWQQAFRNNILTKHGRGGSLAPPRQNGSHAGSGERVYDRTAQLRRQRLDDFDAEARALGRPGADRAQADRPVGKDD